MAGRRRGPQAEIRIARFPEALRYAARVMLLVFETSPALTITLAVLTLLAALVPAVQVWTFKQIMDGIGLEISGRGDGDLTPILVMIGANFLAQLTGFGTRSGIALVRGTLGDLFSNRANLMILEKSESLDVSYFENPAFYDRLENAQREAREGPVQIVNETFGLAQSLITLATMIGLLFTLSWWVVVVVLVTTAPSLLVEVMYSRERFRLLTFRSPLVRRLAYFRWLITNDDYIKEMRIFDLGRYLIGIYRRTFDRFHLQNRSLLVRSNRAGFLLQALGAMGGLGVFIYVALGVYRQQLPLGDISLFFQSYQQTVLTTSMVLTSIASLYERGLFIKNFYDFLEFAPLVPNRGEGKPVPRPIREGIVFDDVHFTYPGTDQEVLCGLSFAVRPGEKVAIIGVNGAGKTTAVKLLARFYDVDRGRILIDGRDLREYDVADIRSQIGVIFQDYGTYQETAANNVGFGEIGRLEDMDRIRTAADKGGATPVIEELPAGFATQLGRWFGSGGVNLSGGQWQKIALARGFMRDAQLLILDEPTAALDVESEAEVFGRIRGLTEGRMAILISHRFTTVRIADRIVVIADGRVLEQGSHDELMRLGGEYARLFEMQAKSYR